MGPVEVGFLKWFLPGVLFVGVGTVLGMIFLGTGDDQW